MAGALALTAAAILTAATAAARPPRDTSDIWPNGALPADIWPNALQSADSSAGLVAPTAAGTDVS